MDYNTYTIVNGVYKPTPNWGGPRLVSELYKKYPKKGCGYSDTNKFGGRRLVLACVVLYLLSRGWYNQVYHILFLSIDSSFLLVSYVLIVFVFQWCLFIMLISQLFAWFTPLWTIIDPISMIFVDTPHFQTQISHRRRQSQRLLRLLRRKGTPWNIIFHFMLLCRFPLLILPKVSMGLPPQCLKQDVRSTTPQHCLLEVLAIKRWLGSSLCSLSVFGHQVDHINPFPPFPFSVTPKWTQSPNYTIWSFAVCFLPWDAIEVGLVPLASRAFPDAKNATWKLRQQQ